MTPKGGINVDFNQLVSRMIRAARLEVDLYEEVEADIEATSQAIAVVVIAALASGIGGALGGLLLRRGMAAFFGGLIISPIIALIGYFIWAFLTYFVGVNLFGGTADYGEMLRTIGFAYTPNVLGIASFIPCVGWLVALAGSIWALVAGVVAVRQALDFDTGKAILTCVIGWIIALILSMVVSATLGLGAAGLSALLR